MSCQIPYALTANKRLSRLMPVPQCDFFPERWFDLVVVLRCFNEVLYPRLEKRGYSEKKVQENVECEIMCVVAEDARESYREEVRSRQPKGKFIVSPRARRMLECR